MAGGGRGRRPSRAGLEWPTIIKNSLLPCNQNDIYVFIVPHLNVCLGADTLF